MVTKLFEGRSLHRRLLSALVGLAFLGVAGTAQAAIITYSDEATFISALTGTPTTYDFETSSGFPIANTGLSNVFSATIIGSFDGVFFDAHTTSSLSMSGLQGMSGTTDPNVNPNFNVATIDFTGLEELPTGVGFFGLDLTDLFNEVIVVEVDFTNFGTVIFEISQTGQTLDPVYFGVIDAMDTIDAIRIFGTDSQPIDRAWVIDDLTHDGKNIPEPATLAIFAVGLAGLGFMRRRRRAA